ncbi:hypothetical protein HanHA89_Chr14g0576001 [Helianthus annuus]|nr:hypothetical protein HanHA89_Chr14g0576001 [Helianthus annuus]
MCNGGRQSCRTVAFSSMLFNGETRVSWLPCWVGEHVVLEAGLGCRCVPFEVCFGADLAVGLGDVCGAIGVVE